MHKLFDLFTADNSANISTLASAAPFRAKAASRANSVITHLIDYLDRVIDEHVNQAHFLLFPDLVNCLGPTINCTLLLLVVLH